MNSTILMSIPFCKHKPKIGNDMEKPLYISCWEHLITLIVIVVRKIMCIYR